MQFSFQKIKYKTNIKDVPNKMKTGENSVANTENFKYIRECTAQNSSKKYAPETSEVNQWHYGVSKELRTYKIKPEIVCNTEKFSSLIKKNLKFLEKNQLTLKNYPKKEHLRK